MYWSSFRYSLKHHPCILAFLFFILWNLGKWIAPLHSSHENNEVRFFNHSIRISDEEYTDPGRLEVKFEMLSDPKPLEGRSSGFCCSRDVASLERTLEGRPYSTGAVSVTKCDLLDAL